MTTTSLDLSALQAQLRSHLQQTVLEGDRCDLSLLAHGEANVIFRLNQDRLVRVAVNTPNQRFQGNFSRVSQFEGTILQYLKGSGIGHRLLHAQLEATDTFPYTYLVTNYLEGRSLNYSRADLQKTAETLAHLHRLALSPAYAVEKLEPLVPRVSKPLTLFYQEAKQYAQPYLESPQADPEIVEMIHTVLAIAESRLSVESLLRDYPHVCLVHGDHTYENWVVGEQQAYLIDWEWAEIGSPAGDLGHFLSPVTVRRYRDYHLPQSDRQFFLQAYYEALGDRTLATAIECHFAAFGAFPALRSLCWTAGYWVTANRWYAEAADSPNAAERTERWHRSRQQFPELFEEIVAWLREKT